jgi:hypothetical protein
MKVFFVKYNDPIYVKLEKLDVMIRCVNRHRYTILLSPNRSVATDAVTMCHANSKIKIPDKLVGCPIAWFDQFAWFGPIVWFGPIAWFDPIADISRRGRTQVPPRRVCPPRRMCPPRRICPPRLE